MTEPLHGPEYYNDSECPCCAYIRGVDEYEAERRHALALALQRGEVHDDDCFGCGSCDGGMCICYAR